MTQQQEMKKYGVDLELTDEGAEKFKTATEEAYNNNHDTIAIYYDGALISVPSVKCSDREWKSSDLRKHGLRRG